MKLYENKLKDKTEIEGKKFIEEFPKVDNYKYLASYKQFCNSLKSEGEFRVDLQKDIQFGLTSVTYS